MEIESKYVFKEKKLSSAFFPTSEEASTMEMYLKRNLQSPLLKIPWRDQTATPTQCHRRTLLFACLSCLKKEYRQSSLSVNLLFVIFIIRKIMEITYNKNKSNREAVNYGFSVLGLESRAYNHQITREFRIIRL